jgi:hypothetical protein
VETVVFYFAGLDLVQTKHSGTLEEVAFLKKLYVFYGQSDI